jgi:hypothetical protein
MKYRHEDAVKPKFKTPSRPRKLDLYADRLSAWLLMQTRKSCKDSRNTKLMYEDSGQAWLRWILRACRSLCARFGLIGIVLSKQRVVAHLYLWCSNPAKRSSLIGSKTRPRLEVNMSYCKLHTPNHHTAAPSLSGPILGRRMRCCSMPTGMASASLAASLGAASIIARFGAMDPRSCRAKTAVDRVGRIKQRDVNARFQFMASHYVFEPAFCNPAAGWERAFVAPLV